MKITTKLKFPCVAHNGRKVEEQNEIRAYYD